MLIPSYDFRIFELSQFSPLQAQEYGADTMFSAATPTGFVDYSINQLSGLLNPAAAFPYAQRQFPSVIDKFDSDNYFSSFQQTNETASEVRSRLQKVRDEADRLLKEAGGEDCAQGRNIFGGCGPILGSKKVISDGSGTIGNKEAPPGMQTFADVINAIPNGAGIFLIAIVTIIFLILFVRK